MKKIIFLFLILVSIDLYSAKNFAKEPLIAYKQQGLWYFLNHQGKEMFAPKVLEDIVGYSEGYFTVAFKEDNRIKHGIMNLKGEIVYKPDCDKLSTFKDSMAITIQYSDAEKTLGKYGFINIKGEQVIPSKLNGVSYFSEGLAFATDNSKRGYIDKKGKFVFTLDKLAGNSFSEGLAVANNEKFKSGCIDKTGKIVIPFKYDEMGEFSEGLIRCYLDAKVGFIDKTGKEVIRAVYDDARDFSDGVANVAISNSRGNYAWGFINKKGELLSKDYKYDLIREFSENFAAVKIEKFWSIVDKEGKDILPPMFSYTENFKNGLAFVSNRTLERRGFIDYEGNYVIEIPKFEKAIDLRFNRKLSL